MAGAGEGATLAPGWHRDQRDPHIERFWNGQEWTPHTRSVCSVPNPVADLRAWWRRLRATT